MGKEPEQTFPQRRHTAGLQAHEKTFNITNHQGNANQTTMNITSQLSNGYCIKEITGVGEGVDRIDSQDTVAGNVN